MLFRSGHGRSKTFKPLPSKGTETIKVRKIFYLVAVFQTHTPQGDGNPHPHLFFAEISVQLSNPYPARGRKLIVILNWLNAINFQTHTPQGDGNSTSGGKGVGLYLSEAERIGSWIRFHSAATSVKRLGYSLTADPIHLFCLLISAFCRLHK